MLPKPEISIDRNNRDYYKRMDDVGQWWFQRVTVTGRRVDMEGTKKWWEKTGETQMRPTES